VIILDTNVVSEPLRPRPDERVVRWLDAQHPDSLYITSITVAELLAGVEAMPAGQRQQALRAALDNDVLPLFQDRVLPFDTAAARAYAHLWADARARGQAVGFADGAIAAIARVNGFAIASRNVADFEATGARVIDPWG
jgi:hypothetical protein